MMRKAKGEGRFQSTNVFKQRSSSISSADSNSPGGYRDKNRLLNYNNQRQNNIVSTTYCGGSPLPSIIPPAKYNAKQIPKSVSFGGKQYSQSKEESKLGLRKSFSSNLPHTDSQRSYQTDSTVCLSVTSSVCTPPSLPVKAESKYNEDETSSRDFFPVSKNEPIISVTTPNANSESTPKKVKPSNSKSDDEQAPDDKYEGPCFKCFPTGLLPNFLKKKQMYQHNETQEQIAKQQKQTEENITLTIQQVVEKIRQEDQTQNEYLIKMEDHWVGDLGLALFLPFHYYKVTETKDKEDGKNQDDLDDDDGSNSYEPSDDEDEFMMEDDPEIESSPSILSDSQLHEIHHALPPSVTLMVWTRAYSLQRDGDYFKTMMSKVKHFQHTLTVIKTRDGDILGGYADTPWGQQKSSSLHGSNSFFGGGRAFLFATRPDLSKENEIEKVSFIGGANFNDNRDEMSLLSDNTQKKTGSIQIYKWTGYNDYSQICDVENGSMGMGGGGSFGWFVQKDFTIGSTGRCETFGNPPLLKGDDGQFDIVDMEIYGFKSMLERHGSSICTSLRSVQSTRSMNSSIATIASNRSVSSMMM